jgi:hypothetical protein
VKVDLSEKQVTVKEQIMASLQQVSISGGHQTKIQQETLEHEWHEAATAKMRYEAKMEEQQKLDAKLRCKIEEFESRRLSSPLHQALQRHKLSRCAKTWRRRSVAWSMR